ncbi:MAG: hypothetical protein KBC17_03360 [Candidatus Pacebacteria bacterium]|nr:hypothetical protein [Candidatus Paceibacterota bacterium]
MNTSKNKSIYGSAIILVLVGIFVVTGSAQGAGTQGFGGTVSILGPAIEITTKKVACQATQGSVFLDTWSSVWNGSTDQGSDQTFNLIPDYSPAPHPNAYILYSSVISSTPDSIQTGKWILGNYNQTFTQIGSCQTTHLIGICPYCTSVTINIPYFENLGNVTLYGVHTNV